MFTSAILYPVEINIAEAAARNTAGAEVEVFVDVHIEDRIEIDEVLLEGRLERVDDVRVLEPVFQLRGPHGVEDDTFDVVSN